MENKTEKEKCEENKKEKRARSDEDDKVINLFYVYVYVYGSVHRNIFYEITNRCSYMQSILFHC